MNLIRNIPVLLSLFSTLIICILSLLQSVHYDVFFRRASITLVAFYALGLIIRKILISIIADIFIKKKQELQKKKIEARKKQEEKVCGDDGNDIIQDSEFVPLKFNKIPSEQVKL